MNTWAADENKIREGLRLFPRQQLLSDLPKLVV